MTPPRRESSVLPSIVDVVDHNRAMMDEHDVPDVARRGVKAAAGFGESFIIEIQRRERAGGGVYLLVFTSWRRDAERADHCHIVGPRGKSTKAY